MFSDDLIGGKSYHTRYPNLAVKIPGIPHEYEVLKPRDALSLTYASELTEPMRAAGLLPEIQVRKVTLTPAVKVMILELQTLMKNSSEFGAPDRLDLLAFRLIEELLLQPLEPQSRDVFIEAKIGRIVSFFQRNFSTDIDFEKLCRDNGLSRRSFFRHWKTFYSVSPMLYLQDLKLEESRRLLDTTDDGVAAIAREVNWRDTAYFCRIFRQKYGVTPLQYRKRNIR